MSTPGRVPRAGSPAAERALELWGDWNGRKEGAVAPRLPASGIGTQCQRSAGVRAILPGGGAERAGHPSLFGFPPQLPSACHILSLA